MNNAVRKLELGVLCCLYSDLQKDWEMVIIKCYYSLYYCILYFGVGRRPANSGKCSNVPFEVPLWEKSEWKNMKEMSSSNF